MPTTPLPPDKTKVSYIVDKKLKEKLAKAAKREGLTMSELITDALADKGVFPAAARPAKAA
jgi:hypothetical protein